MFHFILSFNVHLPIKDHNLFTKTIPDSYGKSGSPR
jgi:hypothetical protein